jgi:hypothetical protein
MKNALLFALLACPLLIVAQPRTLQYPSKGDHVSDSAYRHGKYVLESAYAQIGEREAWNYADYWNVAVAYSKMGVDDAEVLAILEKSYQTDPTAFCELWDHVSQDKIVPYSRFGKQAAQLAARCKDVERKTEARLSPREYARSNGYDPALILLLDSLSREDQRYRRNPNYLEDAEAIHLQQEIVDPSNAAIVGALIDREGYPGRSRVGNKYEGVACVIIEHAAPSLDKAQLERWVPVIANAVRAGELAEAYLKMLIDRLYLIEYKQQIFGTQSGVPFASDEVIHNIKSLYGL